MSSGSRSGSSSNTCCAVRPLASRSNTSTTRIRRPRMHGRPPHWSGSTVIRSTARDYLLPVRFANCAPARLPCLLDRGSSLEQGVRTDGLGVAECKLRPTFSRSRPNRSASGRWSRWWASPAGRHDGSPGQAQRRPAPHLTRAAPLPKERRGWCNGATWASGPIISPRRRDSRVGVPI